MGSPMSFLEHLVNSWDRLLELGIEHAVLVLGAVAISAAIGITLGVVTYRNEIAGSLATAASATVLTIPSFALFGLMLAWLGLGNRPAVIALVAYALLPIVRNTITGLQGVDRAVSESAQGMGMSWWQRLVQIDLPLAWPVIIAGLRVATMLLVSIFAIASYIGAGGLGQEIFRGLENLGSVWALDVVLGATLAVVIVALVLDVVYMGIAKVTTPRGIR